ncbi:MAG: class I tRNA ligase family protein, partial [Planctomycetota bacterium]
NALDVDELLKHYGADVCRWWISSLSYENDVKADLQFLELAGESYRKVRNTLRFLLSNLNGFEPGQAVAQDAIDPLSIDGYVLAAAERLRETVRGGFERYEFRLVHQALYDFCNDTLSAFYCAAVKDRLYCDAADSPRRRATQSVMTTLVELLCRLLAPVLPHTADEAYRALVPEDAEEDRCIHTRSLDDVVIDFAADERWPAVLEARERVLKALEEAKAGGVDNPLDAGVVIPDPEGRLAPFAGELPDMLGVSRVRLASDGEIVVEDLRDAPKCERCWRRIETVTSRADGGQLCDRCADAAGIS